MDGKQARTMRHILDDLLIYRHHAPCNKTSPGGGPVKMARCANLFGNGIKLSQRGVIGR